MEGAAAGSARSAAPSADAVAVTANGATFGEQCGCSDGSESWEAAASEACDCVRKPCSAAPPRRAEKVSKTMAKRGSDLARSDRWASTARTSPSSPGCRSPTIPAARCLQSGTPGHRSHIPAGPVQRVTAALSRLVGIAAIMYALRPSRTTCVLAVRLDLARWLGLRRR